MILSDKDIAGSDEIIAPKTPKPLSLCEANRNNYSKPYSEEDNKGVEEEVKDLI